MASGLVREITDELLIETGTKYAKSLSRQYHLNPEEREEVQQEIFERLVRVRRLYDPSKGTWAAYSYQSCINVIRSYFRDHPRIGVKWVRKDESAISTSPIHPVFEPAVEQLYLKLDLEEALEPFTPKEKQILLLLLSGYSMKETADLLAIGLSTVNKMLGRLRIKSTPSCSLHPMDIPLLKQAA